jgi:tetraacyldisaccharide 4'-kinase
LADHVSALSRIAAGLFGAAWEARRRAYAAGLARPVRVDARVVSIGNLTLGGTGKTTCVLHLAATAIAAGVDTGVVCRRYRPGPGGEGDEERMYVDRFGVDRVHAGTRKWQLARRAAAAGRRLVLVDDGFSHWRLHRDLDILLIDAQDPLGGEALLPEGRLREPLRAVQRAQVVVLSRCPDPPSDVLRERVARLAPAARIARASHRVTGVRWAGGGPGAGEPVWLVTATGNPGAVEASAREAGLAVAGTSIYRDHHWFSDTQARREAGRAARAGARVLLTAKDAVRWPAAGGPAAVLEVAWQWHEGGDEVERLVLEGTTT